MSSIREFKDHWDSLIRDGLSGLRGLRLSRTYRILDTRYLEFGEVTEREGELRGELTLVIQCPWRFEKSGRIVTGLDDARIIEGDIPEPYNTDVEIEARKLLARKLAELFHMPTDEGIIPREVDMIVNQISSDELGGFRLELSDGYAFSVFPTGTVDEYWRLSCPDWHLVAEPGRVYCIGEQLPTCSSVAESPPKARR